MLCSLQQVEQLAGHHRSKDWICPEQTITHLLCVPGWQTRQSCGIDPGRDRSEQLNLFAAHDVGAAIAKIRHARDNRLALARPSQLPREILDAGGARNIGRFHPSAVGPDHSSQQQRMVAQPLANFGDRGREAAGRYRQDALAVFELVAQVPDHRSDRRGGWSFPSRPR